MTFPTGAAWSRHPTPVIYPGWWSYKNLGTIGNPATIDGTRAMAPAVVAVGNQIWLYYLAEREVPGGTKTCVLRCTAPLNDPTNFTPANIAFEFPNGWATAPAAPGDSPNAYYASGPFHTSIVPWLTPTLSAPSTDPVTGAFRPWFMILGTLGNNTGVARSTDGGVTFQLVTGANPLFAFERYEIPAPTAGNPNAKVWRANPVMSKSKPYDYGGCGSACVVRADDGVFHLYYTAAAALNLTPEDMGAVAAEIGAAHLPDKITDIGIGYASGTDGVSYVRKTSQALGVTSPAARGSGRVVDPRRRDAPNGLFEYIVSRPMVFRDGTVWRMLLSSHSTDYRARSLHSTDLINWIWDASPVDGFVTLGPAGAFDEHANGYPSCVRVGDIYHCYYTGNGYGHVSNAPTGIGYCTAAA